MLKIYLLNLCLTLLSSDNYETREAGEKTLTFLNNTYDFRKEIIFQKQRETSAEINRVLSSILEEYENIKIDKKITLWKLKWAISDNTSETMQILLNAEKELRLLDFNLPNPTVQYNEIWFQQEAVNYYIGKLFKKSSLTRQEIQLLLEKSLEP